MPRRRTLIAIAVLIVVIIAVGIGLLLRIDPGLSPVEVSQALCREVAAGDDCLRFPGVSGLNLPGESYALPGDFAGDPALVVLPFDDAQQIVAETWLPLARELADDDPEFGYYNVPVFPEIEAGVRAFIRVGLNVAITDPTLRERTITLFLADRDLVREALAIPDVEQIAVLLLSADGEVLWRGSGPFDADQGAALRAVLARLADA